MFFLQGNILRSISARRESWDTSRSWSPGRCTTSSPRSTSGTLRLRKVMISIIIISLCVCFLPHIVLLICLQNSRIGCYLCLPSIRLRGPPPWTASTTRSWRTCEMWAGRSWSRPVVYNLSYASNWTRIDKKIYATQFTLYTVTLNRRSFWFSIWRRLILT